MSQSIETKPRSKDSLFAWGIVWYTVVIIAWGAWVRISHSGDGCGEHWPLCHGKAVPVDAPVKTWIEVSHRYSTAIYGLLVLALLARARLTFSKGHPTRWWTGAVLFFTVTEALIGRQLVTMGLVDASTDLARLVVMPLHLINTSALLFCAVMAAENFRWTDSRRRSLSPELRTRLLWALVILLALLTSGALAALGSHLAPSESLQSGLAHDLSADSHLAVRLRILHPILALSVALLVPYLGSRLRAVAPSAVAAAWYGRVVGAVWLALLIGVLTLWQLAPAWLKISHLLMANVLIIIVSVAVFHSIRSSEQA